MAIFILIMLMIVALFTSYFLQQRKVTAIHETVASIFAGALSPRPLLKKYTSKIYKC